MIVKNEAKDLPNCLHSVKGLADEIIVVDTGSDDDTVEVAEKAGAKVFKFDWIDDFSAARNFALEQATGDYILQLDADEFLKAKYKAGIRNLTNMDGSAFEMTVREFGENQRIPSVRLFKNEGYRYRRRIHETIDLGERVKESGFLVVTDVVIEHLGKDATRSSERHERNLKLCLLELNDSPDDPDILFWTGLEYQNLSDNAHAKEYYLRSVNADSENIMPLSARNYALVLEAEGRFDEADEFLEFARAKYPQFADVVYLQGLISIRRGDPQKAITRFKMVTAMPTRNDGWINSIRTMAWQGVGSAYYELGDLKEAEKAFREAIKLDPADINSITMLASILIDKLGLKKALAEIKKAAAAKDPAVADLLKKIEANF